MSTVRRSQIPASSGFNPHACDVCRRKKRRCDYSPSKQSCTSCERAGIECLVTTGPWPGAKSKKRKHKQDLEDRLRRLEALTNAQNADSAPEAPIYQEEKNNYASLIDFFSPPISQLETIQNQSQRSGILDLSNTVSPVVPHKLVNSFAALPTDDDLAMQQLPTPASTVLTSLNTNELPNAGMAVCGKRTWYLPPPHEASNLLQEYLVDFNNAIPLFDPRSIVLHFEECYSGRADGKPVSWVATYAVLALAHRLRAMSPLATNEDTTNARFYLGKCLNQLPTLLLQTPSLPLVQCLLGVSILLQTSPQSEPAPLFISTALKLAQSMGYNESRSLRLEETQQAEQQKRVFWIAFFMDIEFSLQYGHPPTQNYENIDVELPAASPEDGIGDIRADGGTWKINIFRLHVELGLLQAEVIEKLFSVKARRQPEHILVPTTQAVAGKLQKWATNWLFRLQPADLMRLLHRSDVVHVTFLEAAYFQTIYSLQAHVKSGTHKLGSTFTVDALSQISEQPAQPCHQEARRLLNVLAILPCGDVACCWAVQHNAVIALCVILSHIYTHPSAPTAPIDLQRSKHVLDNLTEMTKMNLRNGLDKIQELCSSLYMKAEAAVG